MNAKEVKNIYEKNWNKNFISMENLYQRIKRIAQDGGFQTLVNIENRSEYHNVFQSLVEKGYEVEPYSDGKDGLIIINWGN